MPPKIDVDFVPEVEPTTRNRACAMPNCDSTPERQVDPEIAAIVNRDIEDYREIWEALAS